MMKGTGDKKGRYMCECNNNDLSYGTGLYERCRREDRFWKKQTKLAYKIAMLPVRDE